MDFSAIELGKRNSATSTHCDFDMFSKIGFLIYVSAATKISSTYVSLACMRPTMSCELAKPHIACIPNSSKTQIRKCAEDFRSQSSNNKIFGSKKILPLSSFKYHDIMNGGHPIGSVIDHIPTE